MATTSSQAVSQTRKRTIRRILVDPDTLQPIENAKKPKIGLDAERKFRCIASIVHAYELILASAFPKKAAGAGPHMDIDQESFEDGELEEANKCITVGNHVMSIIFTLHNINRQSVKNASETSFKIHYKGKDINLVTDDLMVLWTNVTKEQGLTYKDFGLNDKENWYRTMEAYLAMFSTFSLRTNELRLGHSNMAITKADGIYKTFPVAKYGLSGAHHILLEGASFPPERRLAFVKSLGPMTVWLCMLRSKGVYRKKYATAVKRAMAHLPRLDDIIELTKTTKQASEISMLTTVIAEILMITTSRRPTRMFFPITVFAAVWRSHANPKEFSDFFSTTGAGGWYTYKIASKHSKYFTIAGDMEEEKASQIVFHSIFGTYKEDLSVLEAISNVGNWYNREDLEGCFRQQGSSTGLTKITLPVVKYYSKVSCANQTGFLSGVSYQVSSGSCFSGNRVQFFGSDFFDHIEKIKAISSAGKTLPQLLNLLTSTLEDLNVRKNNGKVDMETTQWREIESLELGTPGKPVEVVVHGRSRMFLGRD